MTTRLPLRIEPIPGEWWRSYLLRVADVYGIHPFSLLKRLHGTPSVNRRHLRWCGIAISDAALRRAGTVVNLDPAQIQGMHLSAYDGSALDFCDLMSDVFDPTGGLPPERLPMTAAGPLVNAAWDRYCRRCRAERPGYRALSWRLRTHLVCIQHRLMLDTDNHGRHEAITATADAIAGQAEVLSRLTPTAEHAAFFADLDLHLASRIPDWRTTLQGRERKSPEAVLASFTTAVQMALSPGYPAYQGLAEWSRAKAARALRAPHSLRFAGSMSRFPHLLPTNLFTAGLSDLLHQADLPTARAVSAVGALMSATGVDLSRACELLPQRRATTAVRFLTHLIVLEGEGRAERFWRLSEMAAAELLREDVDYRHREQLCYDEGAYLAATTAEPSAYVRTVRTWLVDQWACTYTSSNIRPSVRDGSIEHFDRLHGPGMRSALEHHFRRAVA
ncbi:TniQ family protein [Janibacter sp. GXQ6167]|uniref:TniQ family protein n=1 Tax=Janibacter sp. GXQ6167 TaxID=3240791 RepID=UPI003525A154